MKTLKWIMACLLGGALMTSWMVSFQGVVFAQNGGKLIDSVEPYQKRIEGLIADRLNAMVPNQNYLLRVFVYGKNVQVPIPAQRRQSFELPGFQRGGVATGPQTEDKFQIERIAIRIVINEPTSKEEVDYLRNIIPLIAEFDENRGDELNIEAVPPAPPKPRKPKKDPLDEDEPGTPLFENMENKDWLLIAGLGLIAFLLLLMVWRMWRQPKQSPQRSMQQPMEGSPLSAELERQMAERKKEEEEALASRAQEEKMTALRAGVVKSMFAREQAGRELVQDWMAKPDKIGGLIHAMGTGIARKAMLPHLSREQYADLEMAVLEGKKPPTPDQQIQLLQEANLFLMSYDLTSPEDLRPDPFSFLDKLSWGQIAVLIREEPVNIKAIVLSRCSAKDSAQIMETMSQDEKLEVAVQIGNLQSLPLEMAQEVARNLGVKARDLPDARTVDVFGPQALVDVMGSASADTSKYLLSAMKSKDTKLSDAVERRFFLFESLPIVPPEVLPQIVRALPSNTIVQALVGSSEDLQRQVIMAFPEQARSGMVTTLRAAQFDEETIMEARRQVVRRVQTLADQGRIDLKQISDAWQAKAS